MKISIFLGHIIRTSAYRALAELAADRDPAAKMLLSGMLPVQRSLLVAAAAAERFQGTSHNGRSGPIQQGPIVVVAAGERSARQMHDDLSTLLSPEHVRLVLARELWPHEQAAETAELGRQRLQGLLALARSEPVVVVTTATALAQGLMPADTFRACLVPMRVGERYDLAGIAAALGERGYRRVPRVEAPGELSLRGDVLDVWSPTEDRPVRAEFFDDQVESLRWFDPDTQRSAKEIQEVVLAPAREVVLPPGAGEGLAAMQEAAAEQSRRLEAMGLAQAAQKLVAQVAGDVEKLREAGIFPGWLQYAAFFYPKLANLLDYVPPHALVIVDDPHRVREQVHLYTSDFAQEHSKQLEQGRVLPQEMALSVDWDRILAQLKARRVVFFSGLQRTVPDFEGVPVLTVASREPERMYGHMEKFLESVREWLRAGYHVTVFAATEQRQERLREVLGAEGVPFAVIGPDKDPAAAAIAGAGNMAAAKANGSAGSRNGAVPGLPLVTLVTGNLQAGCEWPDSKWVVLSDADVFGYRKQPRRAKADPQTRIHDFSDLREGDYVVHVNHGIGRYLGVDTLEIGGVHKDYLIVEYAGGDKLYVPTDQVDLLQKYIGVEGQPPRLYKLGGNEWARVKRRVKDSVHEMAEKLLRLYAERQATEGYAFSPDTVWQQEFEERFQYEETPDQWQAIQDVKADMEKPRPMDRLLCGDVGFGKTEVAIRAAFKAVMDAKQVAVLVPTTILAQQHHRTFSERFSGYPIRVEVLSRFQSPAEQRAILRDLADGKVDVVIGTHRLLSKDVTFRSLGLVIIDEEQRFGVAQKERLKELRKNVDVLTLSATPIPRTLHMSLVGVRDMSLIETPPEDRYPIRTYVVEYDEAMIREAILRELERGGQVYFVYNRVQQIDQMLARLRELVPEARIAVAHGQMDEERLERVMLQFLEKEYDVLLCSTIIETGMDIANVNTLIVYDADQMGLAQLYQLRGRVGRSNKVAHAYFTYRRDKVLTEDAEKRLQAIKEFTELGSGLKVAMRDLEIRGAGNILGPEQHGFIASVGFELYCRLLEESVKELKGELVPQLPDPTVELQVDAFIPDSYVPDSRQKVELYKKVMALRSSAEAADLEDEIRDRFGRLPAPVENLLAVARIKILGRQVGLQSVGQEDQTVVLRYLPGVTLDRDVAISLTRRYRNRIGIVASRSPQIKLKVRNMTHGEMLRWIEEVLEETASRSTAVASGAL